MAEVEAGHLSLTSLFTLHTALLSTPITRARGSIDGTKSKLQMTVRSGIRHGQRRQLLRGRVRKSVSILSLTRLQLGSFLPHFGMCSYWRRRMQIVTVNMSEKQQQKDDKKKGHETVDGGWGWGVREGLKTSPNKNTSFCEILVLRLSRLDFNVLVTSAVENRMWPTMWPLSIGQHRSPLL